MKPYSIDHHKRLNPKKDAVFGKKKSVIKRKARKVKEDPLNKNRPVRFKKDALKKRVNLIVGIGACQVCEESYDLDYPHHVERGSKKDDRYMINICVYCHMLIHSVGYSSVEKSLIECKNISWGNHLMFEKESKDV